MIVWVRLTRFGAATGEVWIRPELILYMERSADVPVTRLYCSVPNGVAELEVIEEPKEIAAQLKR